MSTLIEQILSKLGLDDEPKLQSKTTELLRLLELRSNNKVPPRINEYGKIVLCADIAANLLSLGFEKQHALKLAGLRKSHYENDKRLFEKWLDVNRVVGTKDICIQLGLTGIDQKADELLALYGKIIAAENSDIDINHPQYAAMAVFQACKIMKQKIAKPKLMSFSNLRPTQWSLLEHRWDKFIAQHYINKFNSKTNKSPKKATETDNDTEKPLCTTEKLSKKIEIENYENWKRRMLQMAESKLKSISAEIEKNSSSYN